MYKDVLQHKENSFLILTDFAPIGLICFTNFEKKIQRCQFFFSLVCRIGVDSYSVPYIEKFNKCKIPVGKMVNLECLLWNPPMYQLMPKSLVHLVGMDFPYDMSKWIGFDVKYMKSTKFSFKVAAIETLAEKLCITWKFPGSFETFFVSLTLKWPIQVAVPTDLEDLEFLTAVVQNTLQKWQNYCL